MSDAQAPFLIGERLYLRPVDETDAAVCQRWMNDPELRPLLERRFPLTMMEERRWLECESPNDVILAIVLHEGNRHIGNIALHRINWVFRSAVSGTMIGEKDCWGKGYGTEAKLLLLRYAFLTLGLHRVTSQVYATNERSLRCQLHCGYTEEGRKRKEVLINGEWVDVIVLGVLADEWIEKFGR